MKQQAKLYKEYLDWVEKENEASKKQFKKEYRNYLKRLEKSNKDYKRKEKEYDIQFSKYMDKFYCLKVLQKKWDKKPWYKKLFTERPYTYIRKPFRPFPTMIIPPTYVPAQKATQEGFMDWLVEHKYKLNKKRG